MMYSKFLGLLVTSSLSINAFSQGKVSGVIKEGNTNEVLIAADISVFKDNDSLQLITSTYSDENGHFELELPAGKYSFKIDYAGFKSMLVSDIFIADNQQLTKNIELNELNEDAHLEEVVVRSTVAKQTIQAVYLEQKNAVTVGDGISADVISRNGDRNTGEVLKRVSGASIQDNKYVVVRGMNDRYNVAMVDGSILPSTEPNRKAFSFDIIPSSVIDNIVITKSGAPNLPADFSGGVIQISTKDMPNQKYTTIGLSTSYNSLSTFKDFRTGYKSSTDILGFDDGGRQLPNDFPKVVDMNNPSYFNPNNPEQSSNLLSKLNNDYSIKTRKALPNLGFQISHGNSYSLSNGNRIGINAAATYGHEERIRPNAIRQYGNYDYIDNAYSYQTNLGALFNIGYYTDKSKIIFKNLYNRIFDDRLLEREGSNYSFSKDIKYTAFDLMQKSLIKSSLLGEYKFDEKGHMIDWNLSYNYVENNQPDQKKSTYSREINTNNPYFSDISNLGKANNRLFSDLNEHIINASVNYSLPIQWGHKSELKFGAYFQSRHRKFDNRYLGAVLNNNHSNAHDVIYNPLDELYSEENINNNYFQLVDQTSDADGYTAQAYTSAAYAMMDQNINEKLRLIYGLRVENYFINLDTRLQNLVSKNWLNFLPSLNASYSLNEKTNLRFAYFKSLVRPELREMANMAYYDYDMDAIITGNNTLVPTTIHNLDLKYEYFIGDGEIISASVFYKDFKNTIENNLYGSNSAYDVTPQNFEGGYNLGLEFEIRKNLGFIARNSILKNFNFYTNLSLVQSKIKLPENYFIQGVLLSHRPLTGQSPLVVNASINYTSSNNKLGLNLIYNYLGKNMYMVGNDIIGHVYVDSRHVLDFQSSYQLNEKMSIRLSIKDILNSPFTFFMDQDVDGKFNPSQFVKGQPINVNSDWIWQKYNVGTSVGLSVQYTF